MRLLFVLVALLSAALAATPASAKVAGLFLLAQIGSALLLIRQPALTAIASAWRVRHPHPPRR
jgi:hypothetical protein